ncbi:MAG: hypothetical protein BGO78_01690 [Chloroflexi bacterium 44-23]|nr:MAG: hypothetical protein BGO78_01690 [Chloroflexi bacterium 44-23]
MIIRISKDIKNFQFSSFPDSDLVHGVFSRHGGVSPQPYFSLNLGGTVGDSRENVVENRKRIFDFLGRTVESVFDVWQIHGNRVVKAENPRQLDEKHQQADAIITNKKNVTLLMRFADCVPILLYDPVIKAIGLVHAGWQGTVKRVVQKSVEMMMSEFGSAPENIIAGIGPSIGKDHYIVGKQVTMQVNKNLPEFESEVLIENRGNIFLDLWLTNRLLLEQSGVRQIEMAGICTACHIEDWFSYRAEGKQSGRFGVLIGLK